MNIALDIDNMKLLIVRTENQGYNVQTNISYTKFNFNGDCIWSGYGDRPKNFTSDLPIPE